MTWQAGGGAQIALGLGRALADRGHRVRILAPTADAQRVAAAGCLHRPFPPAVELEPGRRVEEQRATLERIFYGPELAAALAAEEAAEPADVIVVDYLLRTVAGVAETLPAADVLLIHTIYGFHGGPGEGDAARRRWYEPVNAARRAAGLEELRDAGEPLTLAMIRRARGAIVAMPRELDNWPEPPANVVHAGRLATDHAAGRWEGPWPPDDRRPLVVVSLGSQFMNQTETLRRVAAALAALPVRALVLTGEVDPAAVPAHENVAVEAYVPHYAALPQAALVVAHAGTGTLVAAFAAGLPVLCIPLGRDQPENARRVTELELGTTIAADAGSDEIRDAIAHLLGSRAHRARAEWMKAVISGYRGGEPAVRMLEDLAGS